MDKKERTDHKSKHQWKDYLPNHIVDALESCQYYKPTFVQGESIRISNSQKERFVLAIKSTNGSGKTLTMLVPPIQTMDNNLPSTIVRQKGGQQRVPQALMCVPTIALIQQTAIILRKISSHLEKEKKDFSIMSHQKEKGSTSGHFEIAILKKASKDLGNKQLSLKNLRWLLLDEFDQLMKFNKQETLQLINLVLTKSQASIILVSATLGQQKKEVIEQIRSKLKLSIKFITLDGAKSSGSINLVCVRQFSKILPESQSRLKYLIDILKEYKKEKEFYGQILVFFIKKDTLKETHAALLRQKLDFSYALFHGDLEESQKRGLITKIRNKEYDIVLSTDIIARGVDIRTITLVINFNIPEDYKTKDNDLERYIHRVGRTGRYVDKGVSLSLLQDKRQIRFAEQLKSKTQSSLEELKSMKQLFESMKAAFDNNKIEKLIE